MIGTRPEAIKLAPLARALERAGITPRLILTGQHPDLDPADHQLVSFAIERLDCPGLRDPHAHARGVAAALARLLHPAPDLLVVQGDTSSALGGALAAEAAGVALAHVEAGLRSHDPRHPWPEEEFRTEIDRRAHLLFAPTALSAGNLAAEDVDGAVHITGNTGIDAVLGVAAGLPAPLLRDSGAGTILVTCHRRESWGAGLRSIGAALRTIAEEGPRVDLLMHPNRHVTEAMRAELAGSGVRLVPPCGHAVLVERMRAATLVLSDSGGIQEEAATLGVPLLVLRDKTERPEAIATGNMRLVGTDTGRIVAEVRRLLADPGALAAMSRPAFPYGDGHAAERIAAVVSNWLHSKASRDDFAKS